MRDDCGYRDDREVDAARGVCLDCGCYRGDGWCQCDASQVEFPVDDEEECPDTPF